MLPGVCWLAVEPDLPLRYVGVAERGTRRHDVAVVQQSHPAVGRLAFAIESHVADQCLIRERNEVDVVADRLTVVGSDEAAVLAEFYLPTNEGGRRDFVEVSLPKHAVVRDCDVGRLGQYDAAAIRRRRGSLLRPFSGRQPITLSVGLLAG